MTLIPQAEAMTSHTLKPVLAAIRKVNEGQWGRFIRDAVPLPAPVPILIKDRKL